MASTAQAACGPETRVRTRFRSVYGADRTSVQWYKVGIVVNGVFGHARGLYLGRRVKQIYVVLAILKDLMTVDLAKDLKDPKDLDLK